MDKEKKKTLFFGAILGLILIIVIVYFFFGNFINKGKISVVADAPFVLEIFGGRQFQCATSPCEIDSSSGTVDIILAKEGYKSIVESVRVPRWRTVELSVAFEIVPFIASVGAVPPDEENFDYSLVFDSAQNTYKLIQLGDALQRAIVFFPKEVKNPKIFGSANTVLIVEQGASAPAAYKVDLIRREKKRIDAADLTNIEQGTFSPDGKYFLFNYLNSTQLSLLANDGSIINLDLSTDRHVSAWNNDNSLLYVDSDSSFGQYIPVTNTYLPLATFPEINELPQKIVPTSNGKIIYFQTSSGSFQLNLK